MPTNQGADANTVCAPSFKFVKLQFQQTQQHTGIPFIIMQHVMPGIIIAFMQSQHAWIIFWQFMSPEVQVIMQPISVISILHMPIIPMLQQQQHMPFIIMQQLIIPPAIMLQRFCIVIAAVLSSHMQVIFIPPAHFSIFIVQRGTIPDMPAEPLIGAGIGMFMGIPIIPAPIGAIPIFIFRSLVIIVMANSF